MFIFWGRKGGGDEEGERLPRTLRGKYVCLRFNMYYTYALPVNLKMCVLQCVAVCCSVVQCGAVCCSVVQCVAVCRSVLQCGAVCCSVVQCVAVCCSVLQHSR